jgi:hypothetical protein
MPMSSEDLGQAIAAMEAGVHHHADRGRQLSRQPRDDLLQAGDGAVGSPDHDDVVAFNLAAGQRTPDASAGECSNRYPRKQVG